MRMFFRSSRLARRVASGRKHWNFSFILIKHRRTGGFIALIWKCKCEMVVKPGERLWFPAIEWVRVFVNSLYTNLPTKFVRSAVSKRVLASKCGVDGWRNRQNHVNSLWVFFVWRNHGAGSFWSLFPCKGFPPEKKWHENDVRENPVTSKLSCDGALTNPASREKNTHICVILRTQAPP